MSDLMLMDGNSQLPAHLQGRSLGVTDNFMQGIYVGGNRIGLKGSRFRLIVAGKEEGVFEENYLDVIFLGASDAVGRLYYKGAYQAKENTPPTCYSANGITPAEDVHQKQSAKCDICPMNVKGSKISDGQKYKACGYFRRLVVMLPGDDRVYKLDVKAQGLFADPSSDKKKMGLNDYIKFCGNRGMDLGTIITRLSFDTDSSTPKLFFAASRYVTTDEIDMVEQLVGSDEVEKMKVINMQTVDLSGEDIPEGEEAPQVEQEAAPQQTAQRPVQQAATQQAPAQTAQRPTQTAQRPTPVQQRPVQQKPAQTTQEDAPVIQENVPMPTQTQRPKPQTTQAAPTVVESELDLDAMLSGLD